MNFANISDKGLEHMFLMFRRRLYYPAVELEIPVRCEIARKLGCVEREMERRNVHHTYLAANQHDEWLRSN